MAEAQKKLPRSGPAREALRQKGQFWTPDWVAEAMIAYVMAGGSDQVFDPAVGAGAFFRAAKTVAIETNASIKLAGTEIDREALQQARQNGLSENDLSNVHLTDFVLQPPAGSFKAIVANPPYIRHHRLSGDTKAKLKKLGARIIGNSLDGRAGLHIYFLLRALQLLAPNGRLAFILPADTCEGVFSATLWRWIALNYRIEAAVAFTSEASPFPGVDTNPLVFLIRNTAPEEHLLWAKCIRPQTAQLKAWIISDFKKVGSDLLVYRRRLTEGLTTGLSREPIEELYTGPVLGDFAKVMRGIATGANEFFFLTARQASDLEIPDEFLIPAIGRTRDVPADEINDEIIEALDRTGKPTLLFSPDARSIESFPQAVREYLKHGEALKLHRKTLISTRRPWYKMEVRLAPPILFAYLGRRNARFIRNFAGVVPLTGFLCVYPHQQDSTYIDKLYEILRHPETINNLLRVGKSYGNGAIKVEPRALEMLPLSASALLRSGLPLEPALSVRRIREQALQQALPLI